MAETPNVPFNATMPTPHRRRLVVPLSIAGVVILLAAGVFALKAQHPQAGANGLTTQATPPMPPITWQHYRDPGGYFTMSIPANWQSLDVGHGTFGNNKVGVSFDQTMYVLGSNTQSTHPISVTVTVSPLLSAQQRRYTCQTPQITFPEKRMVGTLSAYYSDALKEYALYTQSAYFIIQYNYPGLALVNPGGPYYPTPPPTPTAVPAAQIHADQTIIDTILGTFTPIPNAPLACS